MVEVALDKGDIVVATARKPASLDDLVQQHSEKDRLLVLPLDVTQPENVIDAFAEATRTFGHIDIVLNNAGFGHPGELEGMEESKARAILETNFWGAISVTKEAVRCFRETNPPGAGGRLIQMSSYSGLVGLPQECPSIAHRSSVLLFLFAQLQLCHSITPFLRLYAALEGASEALAAEIDPAWNIKVSLRFCHGAQAYCLLVFL